MFIPMTMVLLLVVLFMFGFIGTVHYVDSKRIQAWLFKSKSKSVKVVTEADLSVAAGSGGSSRVVTDLKVKGRGSRAHDFCGNNERKTIFDTFDKNGDGVITREELREAMKAAGMVMGEEEVEEIVEKMDGNGDGLIDIHEFCESFQAEVGDEEGVLREAFDVFDGNKDGVITVEELGKVLEMLGLKQGLKMEDCEEMIRKVDVNGDGRIDFMEFKKMMKAGGSLLAFSSAAAS